MKSLTPRQLEIINRFYLKGITNSKEIGRNLGISHRTVDVHREKIRHKLKARNITHAVVIYLGVV